MDDQLDGRAWVMRALHQIHPTARVRHLERFLGAHHLAIDEVMVPAAMQLAAAAPLLAEARHQVLGLRQAVIGCHRKCTADLGAHNGRCTLGRIIAEDLLHHLDGIEW
ncbi:hypothetical protein D3C72_2065780 [compost metagenome]